MAVDPSREKGFLGVCLVEGDDAQEARGRRIKRRALFASVVLQLLVLIALVVFPLFSKTENIAARAVLVPAVPYSPARPHSRPEPAPRRPHRSDVCRFCAPLSIARSIETRDASRPDDPVAADGPGIPGTENGPLIPGSLLSPAANRLPPPAPVNPTRRIHVGSVEPAMLIHRVDPVYPPLARQLRREGRVELHAIIAMDGSIQALEVVSGDPLFLQSALAAVREWRYRPTILDGQPVEVDTHVTVIYTLSP
jgi:protein TonB